MPNFIAESPEATKWVAQVMGADPGIVFGVLRQAVVWTDDATEDGEQIIPIDPADIVASTIGSPLFDGHDPGRLLGKIVAASPFVTLSGRRFVAAVFGYYGDKRLSFDDLNLGAATGRPPVFPIPADVSAHRMEIAFDPRDFPLGWIEDALQGAPIEVEQRSLSLNAADGSGLIYLYMAAGLLLQVFATEATKDAYSAIKGWLRGFFDKSSAKKDLVIPLQTIYRDCLLQFVFRGNGVQMHAALDLFRQALVSAAQLTENMRSRGYDPASILYEFDPKAGIWSCMHAVLTDERMVTDKNLLVMMEKLPIQVSLGIVLENPALPKPQTE